MRSSSLLPRLAVFFLVALGAFAGTAFAQDESAAASYPEWIAERFCAGWSDPAQCRAELSPEQLADGGGEGAYPQAALCDFDSAGNTRDRRAACFFTWRANAYATVYKIGVETGENLAITKVAVDSEWGKAGDVLVNGEPAAEVPSGAQGNCYQLLASGDLICLLAPGAAPRAAPAAAPGGADGGAETPGQCRFTRGDRALGTGLCREVVLCAAPDAAGAILCSFSYRWDIGLDTRISVTGEQAVSLDGVGTEPAAWLAGAEKCVSELDGGRRFCFDGRGF